MKCPQCDGRRLKVEVVFKSDVSCAFQSDEDFELLEPLAVSSEWTDDSSCVCLACQWSGVVADARAGQRLPRNRLKPIAAEGVPVALSEEYLAELTSLLHTEPCPPAWRRHVERLIGEVRRLHSLLAPSGPDR